MAQDIKSTIIKAIEGNRQREYTVPDIQNATGLRNREHVVVVLRELEIEGRLASRKKGRVVYYRFVT